jgi:tetratricopeptide (TPR) repeat protein
MDKKKTKPTTTTVATKYMSIRPSQPLYACMVQNFLLVWLDKDINEDNNDDFRKAITKLREMVNTMNIFTNIDECFDFMNNIKIEKAVMIPSGAFDPTTVTIVHDITQVNIIYIFCRNKARHEHRSKLRNVFTDIKPIRKALKNAAQEFEQNTISISFVAASDDVTNKNLDELDQCFMYTQVLKEILITIDFEQEHINEFITYCREQFVDDKAVLKIVDKIEKEYHRHTPIWWYTCYGFLFSTLNHALRKMKVDLIIKLGFFVCDLHKHISRLHFEQYPRHHPSDSLIVYRGQGLSQTDFEQLMKTKGGLLSFNSFLSTSCDPRVARTYAESNQDNPDVIGVLFKITIDPSISSTPFANLHNISYFPTENEILFSMHSVFRIGQIKKGDGNNPLWLVDLSLSGDDDPQLRALTECIREETFPHKKGWYRLGELLNKLGHFSKAQQVCEVMFAQTIDDRERANIYHMFGMIKDNQGEYAEAIRFYKKSVEINQKILSPTHTDLGGSYNNIGLVYSKMGEYLKALSSHEKVLKILQETLPPDHLNWAISYNNIGLLYEKTGDCSKALLSYDKALGIYLKILPANHPNLAITCSNMGKVFGMMGKHTEALLSHEKALEIYQKILPPNHPHLAICYNNIGSAYEKMGEYSKALSYYEIGLEIDQKTQLPNRPGLAVSYNNIGMVSFRMGEYSKALSYYEKALEIYQNTYPNHPDLANIYSNIAKVYYDMGGYSKAHSFIEHAIDIGQRLLPTNHPDLEQFNLALKIVKEKL